MDRTMIALGLAGLLAACGAAPEEKASSSTARVAAGGVPSRLVGMNLDPLNGAANPSIDQLDDAGATGVRFELHADGDLAKAFATYDPILRRYAAAHKRVIVILDSAMLERTGAWGDYVQRFSSRAGEIAKHFGGDVFAYEIWNEPDLGGFPRHVEPEPYAQLLRASYDAIKAVSGVKVVTAGLASGDPHYVERMGDFPADALSTHPYLHWFGDGIPNGWYGFEDHIDAFAKFGKPLWFTEWGTSDASVQSGLVANFFDHVVDDDRVEQAFFFAWSDANEAGFGITTDGTTKKDSYGVFQRYARHSGATAPAPEPPPPAPTPAPAAPSDSGADTDLVVHADVDTGLYVTQCNGAGSQRVWQTDDGPTEQAEWTRAGFRYPQKASGSCGDPTGGIRPLVFTSFGEADLQGVWITQCSRSGSRHVYRVDGTLDGHPAASFLYDESSADCR